MIEVPRDRNGTFEPKIVPRHQRRFSGFDDKILSMYARGMTTREIQGHLQEIYGVEVSPQIGPGCDVDNLPNGIAACTPGYVTNLAITTSGIMLENGL